MYQKEEAGSESCFNELSPSEERKHAPKLEEEEVRKKTHRLRQHKAS